MLILVLFDFCANFVHSKFIPNLKQERSLFKHANLHTSFHVWGNAIIFILFLPTLSQQISPPPHVVEEIAILAMERRTSSFSTGKTFVIMLEP